MIGKLGKRPARHDRRVPRLGRYLRSLPPPPSSVIWSDRLGQIGVMANDRLGDCTCAAVGHAIQVWTSQASTEVTLSDADVIWLYEQFGYNPSEPSTDNGAVEVEVLNYWLGHPVAGNSLSAYASVEPANVSEIRDAIYLFGGVYIGLALPVSAQTQDVWQVPPGGTTGDGVPGSWGGHAVFVTDYDARGLTCITWGALKRMSWTFWQAYSDEAYALLSPDWIKASGVAPDGFALADLQADMAALRA